MESLPKILAVDDREDIRAFLYEALIDDYNVVLAATGTECLELLENTDFDAILLDVKLPDISGLEVCQQIKKKPLCTHISIILISAFANLEMAVTSMKIGAFYFLDKPLRVKEVLNLTAKAVASTRKHKELHSATKNVVKKAGLDSVKWVQWEGKVQKATGLTLECVGISPKVGEICEVFPKDSKKPVSCEVIGIQGKVSILIPLEKIEGIGNGDRVVATNKFFTIQVGDFLPGMILDGLGRPIDKSELPKGIELLVDNEGLNPLDRPSINKTFTTSIKAIDGLFTCGQGQRVGIFAGSGVGKSTLLGSLIRNSCADICVIALIGERGREVKSFIDDCLGAEGLAKSILVVATSDTSPIQRLKGTMVALTIAEYFRDQNKNVLFLCDSMTRTAMAIREIGLARKEPPTLRGYPPSLYGLLARLVERMGTASKGTITAFLTILVEGDDFNEPVADTMRGLLDGHLVLDRELAQQGHFPAISILRSVSRLMNDIVSERHRDAANKFRQLYSTLQNAQELINIGAYKKGSNPLIDEALIKKAQMEQFLRQDLSGLAAFEQTIENLTAIAY